MIDHNATIGAKIKDLRVGKKYTLKQLSEETGLSIGFLSQLERGMSSIAIDSLAKIAAIFEVSLSSFFDNAEEDFGDPVMRSFELHAIQNSPQIIQHILSRNPAQFDILPRMFLLMPFGEMEGKLEMYHHEGEEFIYVLEGVVTVYMEERPYTLYPGDSIQIHSEQEHNWINRTNKVARLLSVNWPNPFKGGITNAKDLQQPVY